MNLSGCYSTLWIALLAIAWQSPTAQADDDGVSSTWTSDALSPQRGRARMPDELVSTPVAPGLGAASHQFFREFAAGEVAADAFALSTGNWSGLKLTHARGRASNAYHFVRLDPALVGRVLETQVIVSGIALGDLRVRGDGTSRQETTFYVVPKEQELWLLREYGKGPKTPEHMAEIESLAFQRALMTGIGRLAFADVPR